MILDNHHSSHSNGGLQIGEKEEISMMRSSRTPFGLKKYV
jgi:hypothetical protein